MLKGIAATVLTLFAAGVHATSIQPVHVGERQWLQPNAFVDIRWWDVEDICDTQTGTCEGSLNGVDLSGWTWASLGDVNNLFNSFIGQPQLTGPDMFFTLTHLEIQSFFDAGFEPTLILALGIYETAVLVGLTRTESPPVMHTAYAGVVLHEYENPFLPSRYRTDLRFEVFSARPDVGYFFYRAPSPGSLLLMVAGMACLFRSRRQR